MTRKNLRGNFQLSPDDWEQVWGLAKECIASRCTINELNKELSSAKRGRNIYKDRYENLSKETKDFREVIKIAPQLVKSFFEDFPCHSEIKLDSPQTQKPNKQNITL